MNKTDSKVRHEVDEYGLASLVTTDEKGREFRWRYRADDGGSIQFIMSSDWADGTRVSIRPEAANTIVLRPEGD